MSNNSNHDDEFAHELLSEVQPQKSRLRVFGPAELAKPAQTLEWLIRGVATRGTYGPFGGKQKTFKTHLAYLYAIAVVSGRPACGYEPWAVPEARPVLIFAGEGGINVTKRRLQRIAADVYGIESLDEVPLLYVVEGAASMESTEFGLAFAEALKRMKNEAGEQPSLVVFDSLYNFHPAGVEVANLYARGQMLSDLQHQIHEDLCGADCVIWVIDHFRKASGGSLDLDEFQQSGMGAWAHSWLTIKHRNGQEADLINGVFYLDVEIGSREGFGGRYEIDMDSGPFDQESMEYERPLTVEVRSVSAHAKSHSGMSDADIERKVFELVDSGDHSKTDAKQEIGGTAAKNLRVINAMLADRRLTTESVVRSDTRGRKKLVEVLKRPGKLAVSDRRSVGSNACPPKTAEKTRVRRRVRTERLSGGKG